MSNNFHDDNEIKNNDGDIQVISIEKEVESSYLDYAMSVIIGRALPDVRDGLKPVHRRILYAMQEAGYYHNRQYKKSARIIGDVLGKYHPHGEASIYDAMVRMAQPFAMMATLVDGQGNWGSVDGDKAAASRYTEARLTHIAEFILKDYDNKAVNYEPNYDNTLEMPVVLPSMFPNILVNGASGIAVGMATSIPTHNISEVIDATCTFIENPNISIPEILSIIPGPDFPTGGIIVSLGDIAKTYKTGRGSIILRSKHHIETSVNKESIVITEIPYGVNKVKMLEKILDLIKNKVIEGISDMRDESDRHGMRVVIELKRDAHTDIVLNKLFAMSQMQTHISFNMLALNNGKPEQMGIIDILRAFIKFREEVIERRTFHFLSQRQARVHILIALLVSIENIDRIIEIIRQSDDYSEALENIMEVEWNISNDIVEAMSLISNQYKFDERQARAILDLRLHKLTKLEKNSILLDANALKEEIEKLLLILNDKTELQRVMTEELLEVKRLFGTKRKTEITDTGVNLNPEELIEKEDMVVTISLTGYVKRVPLDTYRIQKRGGKGRSGLSLKEEDSVMQLFIANTHTSVLFFSSKGRVYRKKVYELPLATAQSRGKAIVNLIPLEEDEKISTIMPLSHEEKSSESVSDSVNENIDNGNVSESDSGSDTGDRFSNTKDQTEQGEQVWLIFATKNGFVRRNSINDFKNIRTNGKIAIKLSDDDALISVMETRQNQDVMLTTSMGQSIRFSIDELRVFVGRDSSGVHGIKLKKKDEVVAMCILNSHEFSSEDRDAYMQQAAEIILGEEKYNRMKEKEEFILSIGSKGFGKRTSEYEFRRSLRNGQGVMSMHTKEDERVITSFPVKHDGQIMLITNLGRLIRCSVNDIRISHRNTRGVTICRINEGDEQIASVAYLPEFEDDDSENNDVSSSEDGVS